MFLRAGGGVRRGGNKKKKKIFDFSFFQLSRFFFFSIYLIPSVLSHPFPSHLVSPHLISPNVIESNIIIKKKIQLFTLRESRRGHWRLGGLEAWRLEARSLRYSSKASSGGPWTSRVAKVGGKYALLSFNVTFSSFRMT